MRGLGLNALKTQLEHCGQFSSSHQILTTWIYKMIPVNPINIPHDVFYDLQSNSICSIHHTPMFYFCHYFAIYHIMWYWTMLLQDWKLVCSGWDRMGLASTRLICKSGWCTIPLKIISTKLILMSGQCTRARETLSELERYIWVENIKSKIWLLIISFLQVIAIWPNSSAPWMYFVVSS